MLPRKKSKMRQDDRLSFLIANIAIIASLVGAVFSLVAIRNEQVRNASKLRAEDLSAIVSRQQQAINELQARLGKADASSSELRDKILQAMSHAGSTPHQDSVLSAADRDALQRAAQTDQDLNRRLSALESALTQSPEKAIALPLLRQQLNDLQDKIKSDSDGQQAEINRVYGILEWLLGLIITLIIGVAGLAFNSFRRDPERPHSSSHLKHEDDSHPSHTDIAKGTAPVRQADIA